VIVQRVVFPLIHTQVRAALWPRHTPCRHLSSFLHPHWSASRRLRSLIDYLLALSLMPNMEYGHSTAHVVDGGRCISWKSSRCVYVCFRYAPIP
jgi:hypothetical protein